MAGPFYVGVDVGSSSVRAALVSKKGDLVNTATHNIKILEPQPDFYEQSSDDIWQTCCHVVKSVCSGVSPSDIHGIGFDATCSLVVLNKDHKPLSVSPTNETTWNVVMWMDHRASVQAARINTTKHEVLNYVGGAISLEMNMPKILWLKENLPEDSWKKAGHFFDLPDFMTWKATGSLSRSQCSLVCKCTYLADADGNCGWSESFLKQIGLEDLANDNFAKIGSTVLAPGQPCGSGLSPEAASDLGLNAGTPVGTSIIDAHAGGLGSIGCAPRPDKDGDPAAVPLASRWVLISGTSNCHMAVSQTAKFVPGVWGPYYSAMVPGMWLSEAGQSAAGKLIDHVIETHVAYPWIKADADERKEYPTVILNEVLTKMAAKGGVSHQAELTKDLHMWPDFHGNRAPLGDPTLKGMICGLTLARGVENMAILYLSTLQALAYSTKHILEALTKHGHDIKMICACGGLSKNPLFVQAHADITGLPILLPDATESVLLGASILGACASGDFQSIEDAMNHMAGSGNVVLPNPTTAQYHSKKYAVFLKMLEHQRQYKDIMSQ